MPQAQQQHSQHQQHSHTLASPPRRLMVPRRPRQERGAAHTRSECTATQPMPKSTRLTSHRQAGRQTANQQHPTRAMSSTIANCSSRVGKAPLCILWGSCRSLPSAPPAALFHQKTSCHYTQQSRCKHAYTRCPQRLPCRRPLPRLAWRHHTHTHTSATCSNSALYTTSAHMQQQQQISRNASSRTSSNIKRHGARHGRPLPQQCRLCTAAGSKHAAKAVRPSRRFTQPAALPHTAGCRTACFLQRPVRSKAPPHHTAAGATAPIRWQKPPLPHACAAGHHSAHAHPLLAAASPAHAHQSTGATLFPANPACTVDNAACSGGRPPGFGCLRNSVATAVDCSWQLSRFICTTAHASNIHTVIPRAPQSRGQQTSTAAQQPFTEHLHYRATGSTATHAATAWLCCIHLHSQREKQKHTCSTCCC